MGQKPTGQSIVPQDYPDPGEPVECDIDIECINGIKFSILQCSDGTQIWSKIGVCPPRPWWAQPFHYWVKHPWFVGG